MADRDIEHRTEVRQGRRLAPVLAAVVVLAVLVALVLQGGGGDEPPPRPEPAATPEPTPTTGTTPPAPVLVHAVADTADGPRPASTAAAPVEGEPASGASDFEALQAGPIATDGRVVVLVDGGAVLAGEPGGPFLPASLEGPVSALAHSNEPAHVWVRVDEDEMALVDLDGGTPTVRLPLAGDRVLGPATFGLVTTTEDGAVSWRRPAFDATPVPLPAGRTPVDAGGGALLVERPPGGDGGERVFEVFAVVDGALVGGFRAAGADRPAALAPDGATVALPDEDGWLVRDVRGVRVLGRLPAAPGDPLWVGGDRWAVLLDGRIVVSDGTELAVSWAVRALAEASPSG